MTSAMDPTGLSFRRRRGARVLAGVASVGVVAGFSLVGAMPANAATDSDCAVANTATANTLGTNAADIQTLLDAHAPIICLVGTFNLTATLTADYSTDGNQLTIHGLSGAVLDAGGTTQILQDSGIFDELTVENVLFTNGSAGVGSGGAIAGYYVTTENSHFVNNSANNGGAISAYTADLYDSTFEENGAGTNGGAVMTTDYTTATNTTFHHNGAGSAGGAIYSQTTTSDSSTFDENFAGDGGAIYSGGSASVTNSTFVLNYSRTDSGRGGALFSVQGGTVLQSTFWDNASSPVNGGLAIFGDQGELDVRGNIFSDDTSTAPQLASTDNGVLVDLGGNLFTTSAAVETALTPLASSHFGLTVSSLFGPAPTLADNGGPTKTVALSSTSVAIDAVPAGTPSVTVDQRGVARTGLSDAGAYEAPLPVPALASTGAASSTWIGGVAALLFAAGAAVLGLSRRRVRSR